jgi:hypothetical protein
MSARALALALALFATGASASMSTPERTLPEKLTERSVNGVVSSGYATTAIVAQSR